MLQENENGLMFPRRGSLQHFPDHRVLRGVTARRMMRRVRESGAQGEVVQSYLGLLRHGNTRGLQDEVAMIVHEYGGLV
jgi:hypothetical protein